MKAVVLVGGEGTRLRPLTETIAKPLLDFLDRPFLHTVLDHLAAGGVQEAVLASPYLEETFRPFLASREGTAPTVSWITEARPLGTAGAIANALGHVDGTFLAINGDILTDLSLGALLARHLETGAVATIALHHVEDARPFGLVATEGTAVTEFREKPGLPISGDINAGTYVLEPEALAGVPTDRPVSIEREVFPRLIAGGATVSAFTEEGYWRDLGTPQSYLQAHFDAMEGRIRGVTASAPHVAEEARVDLRAALGRWVSVGPGAVIEEGAEVEDSVVLRGATIGRGAKVTRTIVGPDAQIGAAAMVNDGVLGEGARIAEGTVADGPRVGPGADLRSPSG